MAKSNYKDVIRKARICLAFLFVMMFLISKKAMAEVGPGIGLASSWNGNSIYNTATIHEGYVMGASRLDEVNISEVSASICVKINENRAKHGLKPYKWNDRLAQDASIRCVESMASWSHTRPDGSDWWTLDPECMYGEVLAKGFTNAESVVNGWMESPTHAEQILRTDCTDIGLSMQKCEADGLWYYAVSIM